MSTRYAAVRLIPNRVSTPMVDLLLVDETTVSLTAEAAAAKAEKEDRTMNAYARDWPVVGIAEVHMAMMPGEEKRIREEMHGAKERAA